MPYFSVYYYTYSTVSLVPPTSTMDIYRGITVVLTSQVHSSVKYSQQPTLTVVVSCDGGISVLNHSLSWSKFVNTHLSHSSQWFNIHKVCRLIIKSRLCNTKNGHVQHQHWYN